jgi:hypothetical protein
MPVHLLEFTLETHQFAAQAELLAQVGHRYQFKFEKRNALKDVQAKALATHVRWGGVPIGDCNITRVITASVKMAGMLELVALDNAFAPTLLG